MQLPIRRALRRNIRPGGESDGKHMADQALRNGCDEQAHWSIESDDGVGGDAW